MKALPCSWIGNINILQEAIYIFNAIPIKIPVQFFIDCERAVSSELHIETQKTTKAAKKHPEIIRTWEVS